MALRRVLITGGAGFIGAALAAELARRGHSVTCLDVGPGERLAACAPDAGFVAGDVRDPGVVDRCVETTDLVYHLAAVVGVDEYMRRPREVLDVNLLGTRNVGEACLRHGCPMVFASTSEVYGKNRMLLHEGAQKVYGSLANVRWTYALSKAAGEEYVHALGRDGLSYTIVRYFNVYGPLMDRVGAGRVISKFLGFLRDGQPLPLVDGGGAVRSFCYIDDAVEATARVGLGLAPVAPWHGRAVNIGRSEPITVRDLANRMIRLAGHVAGTVDVVGRDFFGPGFEEIDRRVPDVSLMRDAVGCEATIGLDEGLRRTLTHWGLLRTDVPTGLPRGEPVPFVQPRIEPNEALMDGLGSTLRSGRLTNGGPAVTRFEREAAAWLGVGDVAAVSSGSDAMVLALTALEPGSGAAVLPAYTFIATLAAVTRCGLQPVFCDIDPDTWTLDPVALQRILQGRRDVRLVMPVNVFGVPPDLPAVCAAARAAGAKVLYDDAHGMGTRVAGSGLLDGPDAVAFSLHATKVLPVGEGGLVVAQDPAVLREVRRLRNHGLAQDPFESSPGWNAKMTESAALLGLHALTTLDDVMVRRCEYGARLRAALGKAGPAFPQRIPAGVEAGWQNLGIRFPVAPGGADAVVAAFRDRGVEARRYFWPPLHHLRPWRGTVSLPVTDAVAGAVICLPLHSRMSRDVLARVETAIREVSEWLRS